MNTKIITEDSLREARSAVEVYIQQHFRLTKQEDPYAIGAKQFRAGVEFIIEFLLPEGPTP